MSSDKTIRVHIDTIDGLCRTTAFASLEAAQAYAHERVGAHPEIGLFGFVVNAYGDVRLSVEGCSLRELFPAPKAKSEPLTLGEYKELVAFSSIDESDERYKNHLYSRLAASDKAVLAVECHNFYAERNASRALEAALAFQRTSDDCPF